MAVKVVGSAKDLFSLYDRQREEIERVEALDGRALLAWEMGVGKSRSSLAYVHDHSRDILIVSPLSVIRVWENEILKVWQGVPVLVLAGSGSTAAQGRELTAWVNEHQVTTVTHRIVLVNYDSYWRPELKKAILKWQPDTTIYDEASYLLGHTTKRSKFAHELATKPWSLHRLGLTGTPSGARLTKAFDKKAHLRNFFSIMKAIDPDTFGSRWANFENEYCLIGGYPLRLIVGYKNIPALEEKVRARATFLHRDEMLELPPVTHVPVPIDLDPQTRASYDELKKFSITDLEGRAEDGSEASGVVVGKLAIVVALKLSQVCCGSVIVEAGGAVGTVVAGVAAVVAAGRATSSNVIDISDEKLRACMELIEAGIDGSNIVVGCRFRRNVRRIVEACEKAKIRCVMLQGGMSKKERDKALDTFDKYDRTVIVCQIRAGSLGIDLTKACITIMYSYGPEVEQWLQFMARTDRQGQTRPCTVFHLIARKTVEEKLYTALSNGVDLTVRVRDLNTAKRLLG